METKMETNTYYTKMDSPIGELYIVASDEAITHIFFAKEEFIHFKQKTSHIELRNNHILLNEACKQLNEYFARERKQFRLPILLEGTDFQKKVWKVLSGIPYGEVRSYFDVAKAIQNEKAVRAVGQANKANPLPIIIPCHRVIGKNRQLTGYAGNKIKMKEILLKIEGVIN